MIGSKLFRTKTCADSMAWANRHLEDAPDGSVFLADSLESAKGRNNRVWIWKPGQLAVTFLLKPKNFNLGSIEDLPIRINQLNMSISLGIYKSLVEYGVGLKWPNDFILNDKKIGGLLCKVSWQNNFPTGVIFGFGININNVFSPTDELFGSATSLKQEFENDFDMRKIYKDILLGMNDCYKKWQDGAFDEIYKLWRKAQLNLGKQLRVHLNNDQIVSGTMLQVMPNGDIILVDQYGKQQIIPFYNVSTHTTEN